MDAVDAPPAELERFPAGMGAPSGDNRVVTQTDMLRDGLAAAIWLLALGWLWQLVQCLFHGSEVPDLTCLPPQSLPPLPSAGGNAPDLTVIVPACNEEASIEATLRSLLASQGIRLEIFAVNDRSTDQTGSIIDRIAAEPSQTRHSIRTLHIRELPLGWLGKPHAMAAAAAQASSGWLLFTDGDVLFAPHAASVALRYAQFHQADHLVLMPNWIMKTHGERAMLGAMHALTAWTLHLWRVADPRTRDFLGVGAFNLVRREAYEALGGFAALRMEVIEDMRLGWKLKRAGYHQRVALGPRLASVRWAHGAWGVVRNLEKNLFALYRFRTTVALLGCGGLAVQIALPLVALATGGWAAGGALLLYVSVAGIYWTSRSITRVPPAYCLLFPFASSLFLFALLRSVTLALWRGGVVWRGTLYALKDLRAQAGRFW